MKFGSFVVSLFLIYEASFHLVRGVIISDCTKLLSTLNGDSKDYANSCCSDNGIICDNEGFITRIVNAIPYYFISKLESFPYLTRIKELHLSNYELEKIPDTILNLTTLTVLNLSNNNIEVIPSDIQKLSQLEELQLGNNKIKKLPYEIFNLNNLAVLNLHDNLDLESKFIKFSDSPLSNCNFNMVNVSCYQHRTCETINFNNKVFSDAEAEQYFKICTGSEIEEVLNNKKNIMNLNRNNGNGNGNDNNEKSQKVSPLIIIGCILIIGVSIGIMLNCILLKNKRKSKKSIRSAYELKAENNVLLNVNPNISRINNNIYNNKYNNYVIPSK